MPINTGQQFITTLFQIKHNIVSTLIHFCYNIIT